MPTFKEQAEEIRQKRVGLVVQARKLTDKASEEKRELRADESEQFDTIMREVDGLKERMDKCERAGVVEDDEKKREDEEDERKKGKGDDPDDPPDEDDDDDEDDERSKKRPKTVPAGEKRGKATREPWESKDDFRNRQRRSTHEYRQVFNHYLVDGVTAFNSPTAQRAIAADSDIVGGYMVAPQEFVGSLIKFVDNLLWIRQLATKYTVKAAQSLGAPSLDVDVADSDWTSELDTGNEDTAMAFGKRELTPRPLAKRLKVSNRLLRMASVTGGFSADNSVKGGGPEGLVKARLGYKFAVTQEKAFMTGTGTNQPLGLFIASSRGISTGRDVQTGSATGFTADGLITAKYNQKVQYWSTMKWLFSRSALQAIRKLKDGNGQYLWVPSGMGSVAGYSDGADKKVIGDSLLDVQVMSSEYVPSTFTTGQYVGLLGSFQFYWIVDSETMQIQRLVELYAAANQTGFIARQELDAMPVLEEAFTRLITN